MRTLAGIIDRCGKLAEKPSFRRAANRAEAACGGVGHHRPESLESSVGVGIKGLTTQIKLDPYPVRHKKIHGLTTAARH